MRHRSAPLLRTPLKKVIHITTWAVAARHLYLPVHLTRSSVRRSELIKDASICPRRHAQQPKGIDTYKSTCPCFEHRIITIVSISSLQHLEQSQRTSPPIHPTQQVIFIILHIISMAQPSTAVKASGGSQGSQSGSASIRGSASSVGPVFF